MIHQLVKVVNYLVNQQSNKNMCSEAVLLDVSNAFNKIWYMGLQFKLANGPMPILVVWLMRSYLTN